MFWILIWTAIISYLCYLWDVYNYWRRRGVCGPIPVPLIGNYGPILFHTMNEFEFMNNLYKKYPNEKLIGIYRGLQPVLLVRDIELVKRFLIKDSQYFNIFKNDMPTNIIKFDAVKIPSSDRLNARRRREQIDGILYKRRTYDNCISRLQSTAIKTYLNHVDELVKKKTIFDVQLLQHKLVLQVTSALIFGMEVNTFQNDSEYEQMISYIITGIQRRTRSKKLAAFPLLFSIFNKFTYSYNAYNKLTSFIKKFINENKNNCEDPTTILEHLLQLQGKQFASPLTGNIVDIDCKFITQFIVVLLIVGIEPTSRLLSFMFYELAMNQSMQNKIYEEVAEVLMKHNGKLSVNALFEMKNLEMVMREVARLYFSEVGLERKCVTRYNIPGTEVTIDERTTVYVLRNGFKKDPEYFPNPDVFDPFRFSTANKRKFPRMAYLPFGAGPHTCMGKNMADFIVLLTMATLLQKYRIVPCDLTPRKLEKEQYGATARGSNVRGDIMLGMEARTGLNELCLLNNVE